MKKGFKSYQSSCSSRFEIWGVSSNAPGNNFNYDFSNYHNPNAPYGASYPYTKEYESGATVQVRKEILPELYPAVDGTVFTSFAAKVPASYPTKGCVKLPVTSSKADGSWSAELDQIAAHTSINLSETEELHDLTGYRSYFSSRAIYVDGEQRYLAYRGSGINSPIDNDVGFGGANGAQIGDLYIIDIKAQAQHGASPYRMQSWAGAMFLGPIGGPMPITQSEENALFVFPRIPIACGGIPEVMTVPAVNCTSYGKEYMIYSTYSPSQAGSGWGVGRIKLQGTRPAIDETPASPGMEVFASPYQLSPTSGIAYPDVGISHEGEFAIVLPSCRVYIDSSVITEENPTDEAWVCALRTYGTPKLITAQWLSSIYRGTSDPVEGSADGTLSSSEVAGANVIVDPADSALNSLFPDESWDGLRVLCYNRVYNPITQHSVDLLLFTTGGEPQKGAFIADFADGDEGYDPTYIDHGLPDGESFTNYGSIDGNLWQAASDDYRPGSSDNRSAYANINAVIEGTTDLEITVNVVDPAPLTFWFKFDNRRSGERQPGFPFSELTNFPEVDHYLKVFINGVPATMTIDYGEHASGGPLGPQEFTYINNENVKFEEESYIWYQATINLEAGTQNIHWSVNRKWQDNNGHLKCWIDDIEFPEVLTGDDIEGAKRWYFDGTRVRKANAWAWARRNEEGTSVPGEQDPITGRAPTTPTYITMDSEGRILYGNPHYIVCIRMDPGHEGEIDTEFGGPRGEGFSANGGYIRFTATPNTFPPEPPCDDPDVRYPDVDVVADPPWGAFQILPTQTGFQIRGANAAIRDATTDPIPRELFTYRDPRTGDIKQEEFHNFLTVRSNDFWNNRPHSWTITGNGKELVPHLEVIWRPTLDQPAWPEAPDPITGTYPSPPYRADFNTTDYDNPDFALLPGNAGIVRWRNPFFVPPPPNGRKYARHALKNYVVPATYSDTFSQRPQFCWIRVTDDPPEGLDEDGFHDPAWYIPTGPLPFDSTAGTNGTPWGSAEWVLVQLRFCPTGLRWMSIFSSWNTELLCPENPEDPESPAEEGTIIRIDLSVGAFATCFIGSPDFDAIYDSGNYCQ